MTRLLPFQRRGVRAIYQFRGRALLADEQGLGKTIQALDWVRRIPKHRPVIIVVPASVKYTWQSEAMIHFGMRTEVLEGRANGNSRVHDDIVLLNYDILKSWLPHLRRARPRCLIFDEVHYLKNPMSDRTKAARKLAEQVPSVIGLSGTPMTNHPVELWSVLQIIHPKIFPSFGKFVWRYCQPKYTPWGWRYRGARRKGKLHRILRKQCMIRRLKKNVLPELPDKIKHVVPFRLSKKAYHEYNRAQADFMRWLRTRDPGAAYRARKSQALVKVGYLMRLAVQMKLEWTTKWISDFLNDNPSEKLVAFTMHRFVIDHMRKQFPNSVVVDGRVTGRKREEAVRKFQSNRKTNLFFGNVRAAGIGITLTAASNIVHLDLPWTPGDLLQAGDRVHRIGQKNKVIEHYLMALGTVEEKLLDLLMDRTSVLGEILDGKRDMQSLSVLDELIKHIGAQ